tara:strand:+ start:2904 stop:5588 length:2685 start_codon:yes stop_codon:yes gene_type:complete
MALIDHLQQLDDNSLVLASTERVSRHLKMQAALLQSVAGKRSWFAKGKISTVSQWIENAWLELLPDEQLLYPVQELAVVKNVADRSGLLPENQISSTSTARRIAQAYSQFIKFKLPDDPDRFKFKREYEVFWQWRALIKQDCIKNGAIFRAELPGRVLSAIKAGEISQPNKIVLVGVLFTNPAEMEIFDTLEAMGTEVVKLDIDGEAASPKLVRAVNQAEEFEHVATWVNKTLTPYIETPHAAPSIALLVPDMRSYQSPLIEALTMTVSPASLLPPVDGVEAREPWDVSSGATLGARPIICSAMAILSISQHRADQDTISRVLRSEWVGGHSFEGPKRALTDVWLRENAGLNMSGFDYLRALENGKPLCEDFVSRFKTVLKSQSAVQGGMFPSEWAEFFTRTLETMGWPESESLSSANFQTLEAWEEALKLFRALDFQLGPCNYERAYMWLREIVDTRQFQPRLGHVAPVAIMSYTDAVGLNFDHVWILGASNQVLPLPADPSPFLPIELLSEAGVPEATSDGQLLKAQKLVEALLVTSNEITVSSFEQDDRGSSAGGSELFGKWPDVVRGSDTWAGFEGNMVGSLDRENYVEEIVPAMDDAELAELTGGVSVFKNYAHEPFFAFACNRLKASPFPQPSVGFDPRIQGTMIHLCLELFWKDVRTQQELLKLSSAELENKVHLVVESAGIQHLHRLSWRYGKQLIRLELARLKNLMASWLEVEKAREFPFEVLAFELRTEVDVFGVPLTVTLDRIDRISPPTGQPFQVLFDYKSGANFKYNALNATSLKEPQLPIYATRVPNADLGIASIDGISLAQVNQKQMSYHTRSSRTAHLIEGRHSKNDVDTPEAWKGQVAAWDRSLEMMATGFIEGIGDLMSINKSLPVGYDHLEPLIR